MSKIQILNITSKYLIKELLSYLEFNYALKMIKYNKELQKKLDINFKDSFFSYNYEYSIKSKNEIESSIEDTFKKLNKKSKHYNLISSISFSNKFFFHYSYFYPENIIEKNDNILFLLKYKGFKINDYPLPFNYKDMNFQDKIKTLENNEYFIKYTLNDEQIELINLINKLRTENNIGNLIYNKNEKLYDYFQLQKLNNKNNLLIYRIGEMKKKLKEKDNFIIKILLNEYMKFITILEKGNQEYIFIFSDNKNKDKLETPIKFDENKVLNNNTKFHLINNIIPEVKISFNHKCFFNRLKCSLNGEGFQIFSFKNDTLIGVLEGPINTPYENGYFLFKMIFSDDFPFRGPQFIFFSPIFHPNISENGLVSADIFEGEWSPGISGFDSIIYHIYLLLNIPNPDDFLNENAAILLKKNKIVYEETVRKHTSQFANYSKFQEDCQKLNLKIRYFKKGEEEFIINKDYLD